MPAAHDAINAPIAEGTPVGDLVTGRSSAIAEISALQPGRGC